MGYGTRGGGGLSTIPFMPSRRAPTCYLLLRYVFRKMIRGMNYMRITWSGLKRPITRHATSSLSATILIATLDSDSFCRFFSTRVVDSLGG